MKHLAIIVFLLISSTVYAQDDTGYPENYVPVSIADAIHYLNRTWSEEDKEILRNMDNTISLHHGTGMGIRNAWGLWAKEKNSLVKEFETCGIFHADDMSGVILSLFWQQLRNPDYDYNEEIIEYKKGFEKLKKEFNAKFEKGLKDNFESLYIGQKISIPFALTRSENDLTFNKYYEIRSFDWGNDGVFCVVGDTLRQWRGEYRDFYVFGIVREKGDTDDYPLTIEIYKVWYKNDDDAIKNTRMNIGDFFVYKMRDYAIDRDPLIQIDEVLDYGIKNYMYLGPVSLPSK